MHSLKIKTTKQTFTIFHKSAKHWSRKKIVASFTVSIWCNCNSTWRILIPPKDLYLISLSSLFCITCKNLSMTDILDGKLCSHTSKNLPWNRDRFTDLKQNESGMLCTDRFESTWNSVMNSLCTYWLLDMLPVSTFVSCTSLLCTLTCCSAPWSQRRQKVL